MDWNLAAERNHEDLTRIVAGLFLTAGLVAGAGVKRLKRPIYRAILAVLRPAEAAARRLIVYAGRSIVLDLPPAKDHPVRKKKDKSNTKEKTEKAPGSRKSNPWSWFQLFDPRKGIAKVRRKKKGREPRVWILDDFIEELGRRAQPKPAPEPDDGTVDAQRLIRRLLAIQAALADLPGQALRLARIQARRARAILPRFTSPLRYGPAPGQRETRRKEIHHILAECHALAWDVIRDDTS